MQGHRKQVYIGMTMGMGLGGCLPSNKEGYGLKFKSHALQMGCPFWTKQGYKLVDLRTVLYAKVA